MQRRFTWLVAPLLLVAIAVAVTTPVAAQSRPRVALVGVEGPQARKVQGYIEAALQDEAELVDAGGASTPTSNSGFADLAERLDVQALVTARVEKSRRFVVTVTVRQGRDGSVVSSETWAEKKAPKLSVVERELWSKLGDAITSAEGPVAEPAPTAAPSRNRPARNQATREPTEEDEETAGDEDSDEASDEDVAAEGEWESDTGSDTDSARRPALIVDLGVGPIWRDQAYNDTAMNAPFRYFNEIGSPALWVSLSLGFYPLALSGDGMLANLGVVGGLGMAPGAGSTTEDGTDVPTNASAFHVGVRGRVPMDRSELGVTIAYGARNFSTDAPASTEIPDVSHQFLRLAGDGHLALADALALELNLGYLLRLGSGELEDDTYFPNLSGGGIELGLAAVFALGDSGLSLRAGLDWQRFYFSFNPEPGDMRIAGGAVDNYYTFMLGARYALTTK